MSATAEEQEVFVCEFCDAEFPTCGLPDAEDRAFAIGWKFGWDGWVCPECDGDIEETLH